MHVFLVTKIFFPCKSNYLFMHIGASILYKSTNGGRVRIHDHVNLINDQCTWFYTSHRGLDILMEFRGTDGYKVVFQKHDCLNS
jgi:hypothetical protein